MRSLLAVAGAAAVAFAAVPAAAGTINTMSTIASTYNVYTVGDMGSSGARYSSDSEGNMAVGGNAYWMGFGAYSDVATGGSLSIVNGQVNGNATSGGTISLQSAAVRGIATQNTAPTLAGGLSFSEVSAALVDASAQIGGLAGTGTTFRNPYGQLSLSGADAGLNVFNVSAADVSGINNFRISAPTGSTVLVNVAGDALNFSNFGFSLSGVDASNILFNFTEATSLSFAGLSWQGSILAPAATVSAKWGNFEGSVMVGSLLGIPYQNAEFHDVLFGGNIGSIAVAPVPLPAGLPLFGAGLVILAAYRGVKARRSRAVGEAAA